MKCQARYGSSTDCTDHLPLIPTAYRQWTWHHPIYNRGATDEPPTKILIGESLGFHRIVTGAYLVAYRKRRQVICHRTENNRLVGGSNVFKPVQSVAAGLLAGRYPVCNLNAIGYIGSLQDALRRIKRDSSEANQSVATWRAWSSNIGAQDFFYLMFYLKLESLTRFISVDGHLLKWSLV